MNVQCNILCISLSRNFNLIHIFVFYYYSYKYNTLIYYLYYARLELNGANLNFYLLQLHISYLGKFIFLSYIYIIEVLIEVQ